MLTNNHCVTGCLAQNSTREMSLIETGVLARSRDDELRCPTQIADVLDRLEDITPLVTTATRGLNDFAAKKAAPDFHDARAELRRYFA